MWCRSNSSLAVTSRQSSIKSADKAFQIGNKTFTVNKVNRKERESSKDATMKVFSVLGLKVLGVLVLPIAIFPATVSPLFNS